MSQIFQPATDEELASCFPVFQALRPHLTEAVFVDQVRRQWEQGYRIVALRQANQVSSAAGYRFAEFLAWGKVLYIDDLSTLPCARKQGQAGKLLEWLMASAREQACHAVHLDSGHQRHEAHRLYLNKGFVLSSHHLSRSV